MGWAAGFQAGSRAVGDAIDTYYAIKERKDLEKAMGLKPQEMQARQATPEEISRAQAETRGLAAQDAETFGLSPQEQQMYAPTMPQEGQRVGLSTYQLGNQTFNRQPTQAEIDNARYTAAADVVALRNPLEAQRMRLAATQEQRAAQGFESEQQLRGLQLKEAQRKEDKTAQYETGLSELSKQKFDKPEDRTAAILDLIEKTQGPAARLQLEGQYSQNALNKITLKAKEFEDGFKQSFSKGVDATMKWLDEQDPGFTLQRVGNQIIQTNLDGSRRVFAQGTERDIMEQFAGQASPSNFLALSKNMYDRQNDARRTAALEQYYGSMGAGGPKSLKGKIEMFKEVYGRDPSEKEKGQLAGLVQKDSSKPEFNPKDYAATIKSFTDAGLSLPDATVRADELYGRIGDANSEIEALAALNEKKGKGLAKPPSETPPAAPAPQTRYIREKNNRGGYTYTVSPRGLTREQYAEIDRNK